MPSVAAQLRQTEETDRILLVEPDEMNQRVATAMLERLGFGVDIATDGAKAVELAVRTRYRAILMEFAIPVLDGCEATSEIRRRQGASRHTPIIAVTASVALADHQRRLTAGMDDYLTKPLSLPALEAVLACWAPTGADPTLAADPAEALRAAHDAHVETARSAEPAPAALNPVVIERLIRLGKDAGEDLMGQLAALFLLDAASKIAALHASLATSDAPALVLAAHSLRGAAGNLGATDLARVCTALESDGSAADLARAGTLLGELETELARVRIALEPWIAPC